MSVQALGLRAYSDALQHFNKVDGSLKQGMPVGKQTLFSHTLTRACWATAWTKGRLSARRLILSATLTSSTRPSRRPTASARSKAR